MKTLLAISFVLMALLAGRMLSLESKLSQANLMITKHEDGLKELGGEVFDVKVRIDAEYDTSVLKHAEPNKMKIQKAVQL